MYDYLLVNVSPSAAYCCEVERPLGMVTDILEQFSDATFFLIVIQPGIQIYFIEMLSVSPENLAAVMAPHEAVVGAKSLR